MLIPQTRINVVFAELPVFQRGCLLADSSTNPSPERQETEVKPVTKNITNIHNIDLSNILLLALCCVLVRVFRHYLIAIQEVMI